MQFHNTELIFWLKNKSTQLVINKRISNKNRTEALLAFP